MGFAIQALDYRRMREEFFEEQIKENEAKAEWNAKRSMSMKDKYHIAATEYGMKTCFMRDALNTIRDKDKI